MRDISISLDTNIWIFGILQTKPACIKILQSLSQFDVILPNQVRLELERNLSPKTKKLFYQIAEVYQVCIDTAPVPKHFVHLFYKLGLKKGDAEIGAFCQWRKIDIFISENRDFLRGLAQGHNFKVMPPKTFCESYLA